MQDKNSGRNESKYKADPKNNPLRAFGVADCAPADALVIGFDNGAGNCCAVLAETNVDGKINYRRMYFDAAGATTNLYTVLTLAGEQEILGKEGLRTQGKDKKLYVNFKRPPGTDEARQTYAGDFEAPSYEALMRRFFQSALAAVFQYNKSYLAGTGKKRAIVFVGRPASQIWEQHALDYQKLLGEGLSIPDFDGKIDLVIYSEPQAAMAYEYSQGKVQTQETVLIVDCGSSTFDAVLVHGREIIAEYSRQLGAGEIEKLMLDQLLAQDDGQALQSVDARLQMREDKLRRLVGAGNWGEHVAQLRTKKEDFYGQEGQNGDPNLMYSVQLQTETSVETVRRFIDGEFMHQVIRGIPIRVMDSYQNAPGIAYGFAEYPSFYHATEAFLQEARAKCEQKGQAAENIRVILTGGASVMPFIGELVRKCFGKTAFGVDKDGNPLDRSENPAFSVGEGLAFMGYVELLKRKVYRDAKAEIVERVNGASDKLRGIVCEPYLDASWQSLVRDLKVWSETDRFGDTLASGVQGDGVPIPVDQINKQVQQSIGAFGAEIGAQVAELMEPVLGKIDKKLAFSVKKEDIGQVLGSTAPLGVVTFNKKDLLGFVSSWQIKSTDQSLSVDVRKHVFQDVLKRADRIRNATRAQLWKKAEYAVPGISQKIIDSMIRTLDNYINKITPYLVERYGG